MFIALKDQTSSAGKHPKGSPIPEAAKWDVETIRNLVNAKALRWDGEGGQYGPHTEAIRSLVALAEASKPAAKDPDGEVQVSRAEMDAFKAVVSKEVSRLVERMDALEVEVGALRASKAEGSAPAPVAVPSASKGGR